MARQKKLVRAVCAVLALLTLATLVLPALSRAFADDETPAEKVERLRKEISALHEQIKDSEASEKKRAADKAVLPAALQHAERAACRSARGYRSAQKRP